MNSNQNEAIAREFTHALHALEKGELSEVERVVSLFAPDATLNNSALDGKGQTLHGSEDIARFWREYKETLGDVYSQFHQITANDEAAGLFWTTTGANDSGNDVSYHGSTLLEFDESGKIKHFRGYYDTRELTLKSQA